MVLPTRDGRVGQPLPPLSVSWGNSDDRRRHAGPRRPVVPGLASCLQLCPREPLPCLSLPFLVSSRTMGANVIQCDSLATPEATPARPVCTGDLEFAPTGLRLALPVLKPSRHMFTPCSAAWCGVWALTAPARA